MKNYAKNTEDTLITFHTGRGGRFHNAGHTTYCNQDMTIDSYVEDLFTRFENEGEIRTKIAGRDNLTELMNKAEYDSDAKERIERLFGPLGELMYVTAGGSEVGLKVDNDGTGVIDADGEYDTTVVCRLNECSTDQLELIYNSSNYVSSDVRDYCEKALIEAGIIDLEEEEEDEE